MGEGLPQPAHKPRAKFEWLIIMVVLVAGVGVTVGLLRVRDRAQRGELMLQELAQLRSATALYKTVMKQNPPSLETLARETYHLSPGEAPRPFLQNIKPNPSGKIIDPFGNSYAYDLQKGWVHSTSKGFESW